MTQNKDIPLGYKDSALGIIPLEWEAKRLGDVCNIKGGYAFDSKAFQLNGKYQIVKMSNLYEGVLNLYRSQSFLDEIPKSAKDCLLNKGDILITLTGTVGKTDYGYSYQIKDEQNLLVNQRVAKITSTNIKSEYLYFSLKTARFFTPFFYSSRGGTGNQSNVSTNDILNIVIPYPPLAEQDKIAKILSLWDDAIKKQKKLVEQFELRKRGLMQQLLTAKIRVGGFVGVWEGVKLGSICERLIRKNSEGNKNVVTISAQQGFVIQTDYFSKRISSTITEGYFLIYRNEFCYNKSYSNGYPMGAIKRLKCLDKAVVTTLYICFKVQNTAKINIDFIEHYCNNGGLNKGLSKVANEGGRAHGLLNVTPTDFFNLKLNIPSLLEQTAIANILTSTDQEINLAKKKLELFRTQKRALMQQLLTGKTRVKIN